jgi:hypothetical protein
VTSGDDTTGGVDSASAASVSALPFTPATSIGNPEGVDETRDPTATLPDNEVLRGLVEAFDDAVWESSAGQDVVRLPAERFAEFGVRLEGAGFEVCVDVTAVDWFRQRRRVRFDVVANILSHRHVLRLRVIAEVDGRRPAHPVPHADLARSELRRARDLRHVRDRVRGSPRPDQDPHAGRLGRVPAAQGLRGRGGPVQFKDSHKVT